MIVQIKCSNIFIFIGVPEKWLLFSSLPRKRSTRKGKTSNSGVKKHDSFKQTLNETLKTIKKTVFSHYTHQNAIERNQIYQNNDY